MGRWGESWMMAFLFVSVGACLGVSSCIRGEVVSTRRCGRGAAAATLSTAMLAVDATGMS